jgi:hypothetical protein
MSDSAIYRRDQNGVQLRYAIDRRLATRAKNQPSDRERMALLRAERELVILEIIFDHLELSGIAQTRLADALNAIYEALELKRPALGLSPWSES